MDHRIIDIQLPLPKGNDKDPIALTPTFYGEEYTDNTAYLKFNNAIKRMSEPREVDRTEVDVEFVTRNEDGTFSFKVQKVEQRKYEVKNYFMPLPYASVTSKQTSLCRFVCISHIVIRIPSN